MQELRRLDGRCNISCNISNNSFTVEYYDLYKTTYDTITNEYMDEDLVCSVYPSLAEYCADHDCFDKNLKKFMADTIGSIIFNDIDLEYSNTTSEEYIDKTIESYLEINKIEEYAYIYDKEYFEPLRTGMFEIIKEKS